MTSVAAVVLAGSTALGFSLYERQSGMWFECGQSWSSKEDMTNHAICGCKPAPSAYSSGRQAAHFSIAPVRLNDNALGSYRHDRDCLTGWAMETLVGDMAKIQA